MRLFRPTATPEPERLLWSRDVRFARRLASGLPHAHVLELDSGIVVVAPAGELTDQAAARGAHEARDAEYGIAAIDEAIPVRDRYLVALSQAVQASGIADRIGMGQSAVVAQTKVLDLFFTLRTHQVHLQPIVDLTSGGLHEYECLFRPEMGPMPQSISAIVQAAIDTDRSVGLDLFIVERVLERAGRIQQARLAAGEPAFRFAINVTPASLLDARFEAFAFAERVRAAGLRPTQLTLECTEQQAVPDVVPLQRQVKALRKLGFGFAVDDAGAGYASFSLIAALRPSVIKIDRDITHRVASDDARQALIEAFVSFGRRIRARLVAEGIETRRDLTMLRSLGVELGQGYLLGRPALEALAPRPLEARPRSSRARQTTARTAGRTTARTTA